MPSLPHYANLTHLTFVFHLRHIQQLEFVFPTLLHVFHKNQPGCCQALKPNTGIGRQDGPLQAESYDSDLDFWCH